MNAGMKPLRTVLICHHDAPLHREGIARWLASWSELAGTIVVHEPRAILERRLRREYERVGALRLLDVLAGRLFFRVRNAARDRAWIAGQLARLRRDYPAVPEGTPVLDVASPNAEESRRFLEEAKPDIILALCKNILAARIFSTARVGTFVLHPGICPEYRNAHGCFWALAHDDLGKVGMTMLRIDQGIDTGPVFGYFTAPFDEVQDSHIVIQHRMVLDNLPAIARRLQEVACEAFTPIPVEGRESRVWGQPWLSAYLRWKWRARARRRA